MSGRKRRIVVGILGLLLTAVVRAADVLDRDGAKLVFVKLVGLFPPLVLIWAHGGYAVQLIEWAKQLAGWTLQIVKRGDDLKSFAVLSKL